MLRKLTPLLLVVPLAARAQSAWEEREWAGDDQYREGRVDRQPRGVAPAEAHGVGRAE